MICDININLLFDFQDLCHLQLLKSIFHGGIVAKSKIGK